MNDLELLNYKKLNTIESMYLDYLISESQLIAWVWYRINSIGLDTNYYQWLIRLEVFKLPVEVQNILIKFASVVNANRL